ncbi:MAG TPA: mechanosensitive ion channel family protein [Terriglobia bacterium]|nr:mechanosensitive ion channel family protein [Terriglobia bacterium]
MLTKLIESLHLIVEQDVLGTVSLIFLIAVVILGLLAPHQREKVRAGLLMYANALILLFLAALASAGGLATASKMIHAMALLLGGFAMVKLASIFIFDVFLRVVRYSPPQILRDLSVALGYVGVGLWLVARAGVTLSGIVTTSAVVTAVIAFSLQDSLGNVLGGLVLQTEAAFRVGDWVQIGDTKGRVKEITWRHISIETRNWDTVIIPNSVLIRGQMTVSGQRSGQPTQQRRWIYFNVDFRVPPTEVIRVVTDALVAEPVEGAAAEPKPNVVLMDMTESFCHYAARYWLVNIEKDDPTDTLVRIRIFFALQRAGISLSVPAMTAFVEEQDQERKKLHHEREIEQRLGTLDLASVELFKQMTEEERRKLAEQVRPAPFLKGEIMTRQGAEAHWLYILTRGSAEVVLTVDSGEQRRVAILHAGDFFGEMSLLTGAPREATVKALEDSECYRLDRHAFNSILQDRPEIAQHLSEVLARRKVELEAVRHDLDAAARARMMEHHQRSIFESIYKMFSLSKGT